MGFTPGRNSEGQPLDHVEGDYVRIRGSGGKGKAYRFKSVETGEELSVMVPDNDPTVLSQFLHNLGKGAKHLVLRITQNGKGPMVLERISSPTLDTVLKDDEKDRKYLE